MPWTAQEEVTNLHDWVGQTSEMDVCDIENPLSPTDIMILNYFEFDPELDD